MPNRKENKQDTPTTEEKYDSELQTQIQTAVAAALAQQLQSHKDEMNLLHTDLQSAQAEIMKLKISPNLANQQQNKHAPNSNASKIQLGSVGVVHTNPDVEILSVSRPIFSNKDTSAKLELDRLSKIKSNKLAQVPKLINLPQTDEANIEEIKTNYPAWKAALLNYYHLVHPGFHEWIIREAGSLDLDKVVEDPSFKYPTIPDSLEMSTLDKIELKEATTSTIKDYNHLVDDLDPTDVVASFFIIYAHFQPNSIDTRTSNLSAIWQSTLKDEVSLSQFTKDLQRSAKEINLQYDVKLIDETSLMSILRTAIKNSPRFPAYESALLQSKKNCKTAMQLTNYLHLNVDKSKLPKSSKPQVQQVNMARTSNNHVYDRNSQSFKPRSNYSSRGRSYGSRGRGGGGAVRERSQNQNPSRGQHYIKTQDQDGNLLVGKSVNTARRACFTKILQGECTNRGCPFNHQFRLVDTTNNSNKPSKSGRSQESKYDAANPNWQRQAEAAAEEESNLATVDVESDAQESHTHVDTGESEEYSFFNSYADAQSSLNDTGPNFACHATEVSYDYFQVMLLLFMLPFHLLDLLLSDFQNIMLFFMLPLRFIWTSLVVLLSAALSGFINVAKRCFRIGRRLTSVSAWLMVSLLFRCSHQRCAAAAANCNSTKAKMPIILDSGCTMAMSGDLSLFIKDSMVPIQSNIKLAQQGSQAKGTHIGKISIQGRIIDCIYVPSFKQTLLSLGWFLNLGMRSTTSTKGDLTLTLPDNSNYLNFRLASNNLFYLNTTTEQSA